MTTPKTPNEEELGKEYNELNMRGKAIFIDGIEKGKQMQKNEELEFLEKWYAICCYKSSFKDDMIEERIEELKRK